MDSGKLDTRRGGNGGGPAHMRLTCGSRPGSVPRNRGRREPRDPVDAGDDGRAHEGLSLVTLGVGDFRPEAKRDSNRVHAALGQCPLWVLIRADEASTAAG
jgi:hypothetical protein